MIKTIHSHGKLLLTSEYLVLDGATALAIPTKLGQSLVVDDAINSGLQWKSTLADGSTWFETSFDLELLSSGKFQSDHPIIQKLAEILIEANALNNSFFAKAHKKSIASHLEFAQDWGLGSSSTLIANIARWAEVDPYALLEKTFGGSGYDIACATAQGAITFQKTVAQPEVRPAAFNPSFKDAIFFVHLNQKQNSRESIAHYRSIPKTNLEEEIQYFSELTQGIIACETLETFNHLITDHEERLSKIIKTETIKQRLFPDYHGAIKSLGGWGGDFVMVTGATTDQEYFRKKGFQTIIPYSQMTFC